MNENDFCKLIEKLRKERGLTQRQLAKKLGVSNTAISKWENGYNLPDISMIAPLCEALQVDVNELIYPSSNQNPPSLKKHLRKLTILVALLIITIFILLFSVIAFQRINKTNSYSTISNKQESSRIYEIKSEDNRFYIDGLLIIDDTQSKIIFNTIIFQDTSEGTNSSKTAEALTISLVVNSKILCQIKSGNKEEKKINMLFKEITKNSEKYLDKNINIKEYEPYFTSSILKISYQNSKKKIEDDEVKISLKQKTT